MTDSDLVQLFKVLIRAKERLNLIRTEDKLDKEEALDAVLAAIEIIREDHYALPNEVKYGRH